MSRKCPFAGCGKHISSDKFACKVHWYSLNPTERAKVWAAYGAYVAHQIDIVELRRRQQEILDSVEGGKPADDTLRMP